MLREFLIWVATLDEATLVIALGAVILLAWTGIAIHLTTRRHEQPEVPAEGLPAPPRSTDNAPFREPDSTAATTLRSVPPFAATTEVWNGPRKHSTLAVTWANEYRTAFCEQTDQLKEATKMAERIPAARSPGVTIIERPSIASSARNHRDPEKVGPFANPVRISTLRLSKPENFDQNRGVPGFIYMARCEFHQEQVLKLGQTRDPKRRIEQLSQDLKVSRDPGSFELLAAVEVPDALLAEELLFKLIAEARITTGREFFCISRTVARRYMSFVADALVNGEELLSVDLPKLNPPSQLEAAAPVFPNVPRTTTAHEWLVATRNPWHRPGLYRLTGTTKSPHEFELGLNRQGNVPTGHLGFEKLAAAVPASDWRAARRNTIDELGARSVVARGYVQVSGLVVLTDAMAKVSVAGKQLGVPPASPSQDQRRVQSVQAQRQRNQQGESLTPQSTIQPRPRAQLPQSAPSNRNSPPLNQSIQRAALVGPSLGEDGLPTYVNYCPYCDAQFKVSGIEGEHYERRCSKCRRQFGFGIEGGSMHPYKT